MGERIGFLLAKTSRSCHYSLEIMLILAVTDANVNEELCSFGVKNQARFASDSCFSEHMIASFCLILSGLDDLQHPECHGVACDRRS